MVSEKEIEKELAIALKEIGKIQPWFDADLNDWTFSHRLYPVECGGATREEVVKNYPLYLREFIKQRLDGNLDTFIKKKTKGHGGYRPGAGRPKGSVTVSKERIYLPTPMAEWLKDKSNQSQVEELMQK